MTLEFVDVGRFASIARNIIEDKGFILNYIFPHPGISLPLQTFQYPPLYVYLLSFSFKIFGVNDNAVILVSALFFLLGAAILYLLAQKIFDRKVALLSSVSYLCTAQLFNYAKDGASEPLFIFEILLISYILTFKNNITVFLAGLVLGLSILTKLQGFWLILPLLILFYFLFKKELKLWLLFLGGTILPLVPGYLGLLPKQFEIVIPFYLFLQNSSVFPADNLPRSGLILKLTIYDYLINVGVIFKKALYNVYNLIFKFSEMFSPPVFLVLWGLSFTDSPRERLPRSYFWFTVVLLLTFLIAASITSPEVRYIHPVLPLLIVFSIYGFLRIVKSTKIALLFIFLLLVLPLLGQSFLDQRFLSKQFNFSKTHINKVLGVKIGELTSSHDIVVTNLDTWGTWYGNRTTVIIPINFKNFQQLNETLKVNQIFLADFQRDNPDHPLNGDWGLLFDHSDQVSNKFILDNFQLAKVATISASENYENKDFTYKVWTRK